MWSVLMSLAPVIGRLLMMILDKNGADIAAKKEFLAMISKSSEDAATPINMKDDFRDLRARLQARIDEKNKTTT